jgi:hypothetical protein
LNSTRKRATIGIDRGRRSYIRLLIHSVRVGFREQKPATQPEPQYRMLASTAFALLVLGVVMTVFTCLVATQGSLSVVYSFVGIGMIVMAVVLDAFRTFMTRSK